MILFPNCKINIGLDILSQRPDGYHELATAMVPVDWCDVLEIVPANGHKGARLHVSGRAVDCPPEKNLVMKAYNRFTEAAGPMDVDIYLRKIIPDGAGLGGGSSDAAYTLRGLNSMAGAPLDTAELEHIAGLIGADCPFFIKSQPVLATGTGTQLTPIELPQIKGCHAVIVKPPHSVSTAEAYSMVECAVPQVNLATLLSMPMEVWKGRIKNDFEPSVAHRLPEIETLKDTFYEAGAVYSAMSGSGSAVFGIFTADTVSVDIALPPEYVVWQGRL